MSRYAWASHRTLALPGEDLAVLADHNSGWCVLTRDEYLSLNAVLPVTIPQAAAPAALDRLWAAGLATRDGLHADHALYEPSTYPTAVLLKLTGTCNIECEYCYDYDDKRFKAQQSFASIRDTLQRLLDRQDRISIAFHGGEPLLRFGLIQQVVEWLAPYRARVGYSIQTNATRFTPAVLDFLEKHEFSVGISLDGLDEASNALRTTRRSPTPLEGVQRLMRERPDFVRERCGFLAVASRTSAPGLPAFATWLQAFGVSGLSITFLDLAGRGAGLADQRLSPHEAVDLYRTLVGMIRRGEIRELGIRNLIARMHNLFMLQSRDLCYRGPCGAAADFLVLDAEGGQRTCDCVYHPYFEITAADADAPSESQPARRAILDRHAWLRTEGETCATCPIFGLCGGTCVAKAIVRTGTDRSVDPVECALSKYIYPELLREFVAEERPLFEYYARHEHKPFEFLTS